MIHKQQESVGPPLRNNEGGAILIVSLCGGGESALNTASFSQNIPREIQERRFGEFQFERMGKDPPALLHDIFECLVEMSILGPQK